MVAFAMSAVVFTVAVVRACRPHRESAAELAAGLGFGLEFLLAAGLLRLSAIDDFATLAAVGAIVLLRRLIGIGLRYAVRAVGNFRTSGLRA